MADVAIKVENLSKVYKIFDNPLDRVKEALHPFHKRYSKDFYALRDVSFEVRKGETIGIIGKNGAGKSTLLKIITGVLTPTEGNVQVHGRIASLLELGAGFNPEMTGIENIYLNGTVMGYSKEEMDKRLPDIVAFADIGDFISQPVKMYSSGMFARLAFAVNAFVEPDILIVDEALSVGDIFFQNKCFKKFEELCARNVTILFVSHDMGAVRRFCEKVIWVEQGKIHQFDDSESVCVKYLQEQLQNMNQENQANVTHGVLNTSLDVTRNISQHKKSFPKLSPKEVIRSHPEEGEIISFFITDENGNQVFEVNTEQRFQYHIVAKFYKDLDDVIAGMTIDNLQGIQVSAVNTFLSMKKGFSVKKGTTVESVLTFRLPMFHEGEYIFSPAIARGTQEVHINMEWIPNCVSVYIFNQNGSNISLMDIPCKSELLAFKTENITID